MQLIDTSTGANLAHNSYFFENFQDKNPADAYK